jgi:hypothetical protein
MTTFIDLLEYHIKFYLNQGFDLDRAIRRGYEEAHEDAITRLHHGDRVEDFTIKVEQTSMKD